MSMVGVLHGEVGLSLLALWRLGLLEVGVLAKMLLNELVGEGEIGGLGHDTLLVEHGDDTEGLEI